MNQIPVDLEHVLGVRSLQQQAKTVDDVLALNGIPRTLVQVYIADGDNLTPIPGWTKINDIPENADRVLVRALRNTLFETVLPWADSDDLPVAQGTGFLNFGVDENGRARRTAAVLDERSAKELVAGQVKEFTLEHDVARNGCVFGVSGGGDSNALAYGLAAALPTDRLTAFTLVFDDVMSQAAADRATVLCQDLGIRHRVFADDEAAKLLGIVTSLPALYDDFRHAFGHEALHFFGTFLILRAARAIGRAEGFSDLAFGYNREDLLAELSFMLMNGRRPLAYPVRPIGEQRIVMPVWRAPKLLLDACHPKFSLENYRERDAHTTRQRSLAFYLAHSLDSVYPSFGQSLLEGARKTLARQFGELRHHPELDVFLTEQATDERISMVDKVLRHHLSDVL